MKVIIISANRIRRKYLMTETSISVEPDRTIAFGLIAASLPAKTIGKIKNRKSVLDPDISFLQAFPVSLFEK